MYTKNNLGSLRKSQEECLPSTHEAMGPIPRTIYKLDMVAHTTHSSAQEDQGYKVILRYTVNLMSVWET